MERATWRQFIGTLTAGDWVPEVPRVQLDRYAARYVISVLVVTRIAVLGARSAPSRGPQRADCARWGGRDTGNQTRALPGYQGQSSWLVPVVRFRNST
jgi:hypothetical protein